MQILSVQKEKAILNLKDFLKLILNYIVTLKLPFWNILKQTYVDRD